MEHISSGELWSNLYLVPPRDPFPLARQNICGENTEHTGQPGESCGVKDVKIEYRIWGFTYLKDNMLNCLLGILSVLD